MFQVTANIATHGLGQNFYPTPKEKLLKDMALTKDEILHNAFEVHYSQQKYWHVIDVRDLLDEDGNTLMIYAEKIMKVDRIVSNPFHNAVICCGAGQSRSMAIALGYLLYTGETWEEAWNLVHAKGSPAMIDISHIDALKRLFNIKDTFQNKILDHAEGDYDFEQ